MLLKGGVPLEIIGIDIGTTSICGVVLEAESGKLLRSKTIAGNAFIESKMPFEKIQSPEKILGIAKGILEELLSDRCASIGVTGQMHGILYLNQAGKAVSPLYTWQDQRGEEPYGESTYAKHLGSHGGYGNVTDFYNRENGLVPKEAVSYCTIHDYLVMDLCGLKEPLIHTTDAASFGLFDLETQSFSYPCPAKVTGDHQIAGYYKGIPVGVAIGDNQASVLSTLSGKGDLLINVGTGSQVSMVHDKPIFGPDIEARPFFEDQYLIVGAALCGGRAFSLLKSFYQQLLGYVIDLPEEKIYELMNQMQKEAPKEGLIVDPRFAGSRRDPALRGSISGISTENFTPAALTQGMLRGMVEELHEMVRQMNLPIKGIIGSGNGVRKNPAFAALCEETFGAKLKIPAHLEEAAFGAALFGAICAGHFKNAAEAQKTIRYL